MSGAAIEVGAAFVAIGYAAGQLANAVERESELHSWRGLQKSEAICRLIGTNNPENDRPHSATSAEKVVESDQVYAAFLATCRESVVARIRAEAEYESAKLAAQLAVKLAEPTSSET